MNPMAVHLFILYWAVLSEITPPVALSVVAASGLAGSPVMRSMMEAMRFGAVKYALPFFFIYNPALVLQGATPLVLLEVVLAAVIGLALVAYALQGYLPWIGTLNNTPLGYAIRLLLIGAGLLLALPERVTTVLGLGVATIIYGGGVLARRTRWLPLVRPES
jgi:TRAP-type uncharacterized transport system fused permease subunit